MNDKHYIRGISEFLSDGRRSNVPATTGIDGGGNQAERARMTARAF
jgi:hypothetical protein